MNERRTEYEATHKNPNTQKLEALIEANALLAGALVNPMGRKN